MDGYGESRIWVPLAHVYGVREYRSTEIQDNRSTGEQEDSYRKDKSTGVQERLGFTSPSPCSGQAYRSTADRRYTLEVSKNNLSAYIAKAHRNWIISRPG